MFYPFKVILESKKYVENSAVKKRAENAARVGGKGAETNKQTKNATETICFFEDQSSIL